MTAFDLALLLAYSGLVYEFASPGDGTLFAWNRLGIFIDDMLLKLKGLRK